MCFCNEFLMNILNDINTLSCPMKRDNNKIELTVHTSCYWSLRLTLCYSKLMRSGFESKEGDPVIKSMGPGFDLKCF